MSSKKPKNWRPGRQASDRARSLVFQVLLQVELEDAYANLVLPKLLRKANFNRQDAAYATNLTYGTLRMQGRYDAIINLCLQDRTVSSLDPEVRILLRMGAHQLLDFHTPAHAAIYETVTLARNELGSGASGLVNAVLRRVSERDISQWQNAVLEYSGGKAGSVEFIASWLSHPQWIVRSVLRTLQHYSRSLKDIVPVLQANNTPAAVALVAREISLSELAADIARGKMHSAPGKLLKDSLLLTEGDPHRIFAVQDKIAGVQDEGSQLVAKIFANAPVLSKDEKWLDLCAGPGGKTATLAGMAAVRGIEIYANELHEHRLALVESAITPWNDLVSLRCGDGTEIGELEPETYDRVLIDVPCSGIGALRRRPESRWRKTATDALELSKLQLELLVSGWKATAPGGLTAYVTCSSHLPETVDIIEAFQELYPEAEVLNCPQLASAEVNIPVENDTNFLQLWPDLHYSDAMFMAVLRKPLS